MFSKFFINRPIFATVLAILMVIAGAICVFTLPIAQYPDITPPTVTVSATYPGANARTVAQAVGVPIEAQVNGVEGMLYMSSSSSDGSYSLTITFENGTDLDQAAINVQNRMSQVTSTLPEAVTQQGVSVRKESTNQVLFCTLESDDPERYDALYLANYAQLNLVDPLSRVEGVGGVQAFGAGKYSMRVWLDPEAMRARSVTPADVDAAINSQNIEVSAGQVGNPPGNTSTEFQFTLTSQGQLKTPEEFGNIIIRTDKSGILRLKDIARVELGSQSYDMVSRVNGKEVALLGIQQLPGANAIEVADGSLKELDQLAQYFPDGVHYRVILNTTDFVRESLSDVVTTFFLTSLIVMIVILLFLQNWRAVVIPMITIPVSLIATFAVMKIMGFSLNTLTLFGLVLAIAIVVDDAIVVVEDCSRLVDKGTLTSRQAAVKAMNELTGPVIGEVLVLMAVFIPTAFISGITGQLYKQFALTIAVSTAFSGFNALTLTPALCALMLKPRKPAKFFIYRWFTKGFDKTLQLYERTIGRLLRYPGTTLAIYGALAVVSLIWFVNRPSTYIPSEDMGYFMGSVELPTGASMERTEKVVNAIAADIKREIPQVKDVMSVTGFSMMGGGAASNMASFNIMLVPWKDRGKDGTINDIIARAEEIASRHQEALCFFLNPPAIQGLGVSSGLQMQLLDINNLGAQQMKQAISDLSAAAEKDPRIASISTLYQGTVPQFSIDIDRNRAEMQGVGISDIYQVLGQYMGASYVNDFVDFDRTFQVTMQADGVARANPDDVLKLSVRNSQGEMVPFSSFAKIKETMGEPNVSRYNMYTTASVTATPAHGVSSSEGIEAMEQLVSDTLGKNYSYAWTGMAYQETQSGTTVSIVFIFAIIMTLLVLAAQYESWTDPIAVVLAMPIAVLGALLGTMFMNESISIYTQIGLILVLGMSAKNAILIVEYAMDFRKAGQPIIKAAHDAGVIRFRPILMTALAFIFGVMPMLFSTGAGANSRIDLGTVVVFGMIINALIGTTCVPAFWVVMQRLQEKFRGSRTTTANSTSSPGLSSSSGAPAASESANEV
ncbi:MAG: multidrug efflux RND transporter permease subunit [Bacteroidales bacterium]|nr:multidrug efflux RND transporter permease subunit [Bacteroidales bacterium]